MEFLKTYYYVCIGCWESQYIYIYIVWLSTHIHTFSHIQFIGVYVGVSVRYHHTIYNPSMFVRNSSIDAEWTTEWGREFQLFTIWYVADDRVLVRRGCRPTPFCWRSWKRRVALRACSGTIHRMVPQVDCLSPSSLFSSAMLNTCLHRTRNCSLFASQAHAFHPLFFRSSA